MNNEIITEIISQLGVNYNENDLGLLQTISKRLLNKASDFTNRTTDDSKLFPYVVDYTIMAYEQRGDEGKNSISEGGISYSYKNVVDEMKKDLVNIRVVK